MISKYIYNFSDKGKKKRKQKQINQGNRIKILNTVLYREE